METKEKFPLITKAKLVLTHSCQLKCKYCYEEHSDNSSMDIETAIKIIDMINHNAEIVKRVAELSFFGGEPLLLYEEVMKPCIEYIRNEKKYRCGIGFVTNGLLLDQEKLKYLRSNNVSFMLSIDGCPAAQDINRVYKNGRGTSKNLEKKLSLILKYFPNTRARMTVTPDNAPYIYESVVYLVDKGFLDIHIIPDLFILPNSRKWCKEDFDIVKEQMTLVANYIIREFEDYKIPVIFETLKDMFPRIVLSSYCERVNHHRTAECCNPMNRCGIGALPNIDVETDGTIYSCSHGDHTSESILYLGNVNEGISEEARAKLLELNNSPIRSEKFDCSECPLNHICTGGCVPNNYLVTGDFTVVPDAYCLWMRILYETALSIIEHFDTKQDNELFKDYFYGVVKRGVTCVC